MKADQKTASGGLRSTPIIGGISQKRRSLGRGGDPPLNKNLGREYRPIFAPHPKLDKRHQNSTKSYTFACKIRMPPQTPSAINHLSNSVYTSNIVVFIMHYCYCMLLLHAFFALLYFYNVSSYSAIQPQVCNKLSVCVRNVDAQRRMPEQLYFSRIVFRTFVLCGPIRLPKCLLVMSYCMINSRCRCYCRILQPTFLPSGLPSPIHGQFLGFLSHLALSLLHLLHLLNLKNLPVYNNV